MKVEFRVLFALFVILSSCKNEPGEGVKLLPPSKFAQEISKNPDAQILDVRTSEEFAGQHLDKAVNVDWYEDKLADKTSKLDKSKPIFVYCSAGGRSRKAAAELASLGFTKVYDLEGGIVKWNTSEVSEKKSKDNKLTFEQYQKLAKSQPNVLIVFYAPWSQNCKTMAAYLPNIEKEYRDLKIIRLNSDKEQPIFSRMKIDVLPTFILYKDGKEIWKNPGFIPEADLKKHL